MTKANLVDMERRGIIDELLKLSDNGVLPRRAFARVGAHVKRDPTTVSAIWKRYTAAVAAGVPGGEWASQIKQNSGRKRKNRDEVRTKLPSVPVEDRAVERRVAAAPGLSRHLVRQAVKEGMVRRRTTFIKPALTPENKLDRVEHALSFIDDKTLHFESMHNVVHVDEKWFYADRNRRSYLVFDGEEMPPRAWKSKRFIPKTMFLAALARPRYDPHRKQRWDGKVGLWSFTEKYKAQRKSKNRAKGEICTRNLDTVDRNVYKDYLITKVFQAIKSKWPRKDRRQFIFVQQDNAKPHVSPTDPDVVAAGTEGGWNIRLLCQAANSPELNCLDLGVFASMQSIQHRLPRKGIDALIASVEDAFRELKPDTVDNIFLTLQACMRAILEEAGGNLYKFPHLGKAKLRRANELPVSLSCSRELYDAALALLQSSNRGSALFFK